MAKKRVKKKIEKSATQLAYEKQVRRIKQAIYRIRKSGLEVDYRIPPKPTRYTKKEVTKLSKITPEQLRQFSYIPDEPPKFKSRKKKQEEPKDYIPEKSDIIYQNVIDAINFLLQPTPKVLYNQYGRSRRTQYIELSAELYEYKERLRQTLLTKLEQRYAEDPEGTADKLEEQAGVFWDVLEAFYSAYEVSKINATFMRLYEIITGERESKTARELVTAVMDSINDSGDSYEI